MTRLPHPKFHAAISDLKPAKVMHSLARTAIRLQGGTAQNGTAFNKTRLSEPEAGGGIRSAKTTKRI